MPKKQNALVIELKPVKRSPGTYSLSAKFNGKIITRDMLGDPTHINIAPGDTWSVTLNLGFPIAE